MTAGAAAPARRAEPVSPAVACAALALLVAVYAALATAFAAPASRVVLATAGGSPGWLLGPWRVLGWSGADGDSAGPLFYLGLWLALLFYAVVLAGARGIGPRLAIGSIAGLHALFLLGPPLLSQDVFSYIAYARLDVVHGLNPYTHSPDAAPSDAVFGYAGSKDATSVYGPLFTLMTFPLAKLGIASAFWTLKVVAALCSLGVVGLTWACAVRLGRDPVMPALAVGLNPLTLVHVVGGAHNDALVVLLWMGAALALLSARGPARRPWAALRGEPVAGLLTAWAAAAKVSGGLIGPFLLIGARRRGALLAGGVAGGVAVLGSGLIAFGTSAADAFLKLGQNQDRTSRWSLPQRAADGLAAVTNLSADAAVDVTRALFAALFLAALALLLRRAWVLRDRPGGWIAPAGWATFGLLMASAWLVPWYVIWLLPLAALSADPRLLAASVALTAYMLVIAVPL